jgi:carbon-monoxide dehydrogenase small subunit
MPEVVLRVNGVESHVLAASDALLLDVLRDQLSLTGAKRGCDRGECGSCNVLIDGVSLPTCLILASQAQGKVIETIEGLARGDNLHPLQQAFLRFGAVQCGYCTPAMILTAKAILDENPHPSEDEIRAELASVICRCTGFTPILQAVQAAASGEVGEPIPLRRRWAADQSLKQLDR